MAVSIFEYRDSIRLGGSFTLLLANSSDNFGKKFAAWRAANVGTLADIIGVMNFLAAFLFELGTSDLRNLGICDLSKIPNAPALYALAVNELASKYFSFVIPGHGAYEQTLRKFFADMLGYNADKTPPLDLHMKDASHHINMVYKRWKRTFSSYPYLQKPVSTYLAAALIQNKVDLQNPTSVKGLAENALNNIPPYVGSCEMIVSIQYETFVRTFLTDVTGLEVPPARGSRPKLKYSIPFRFCD